MSKATDLAKTSTKAGFNYLWGLVISTVISLVGTLSLTIMLDTEVYALYGLAFSIPTLIALFRGLGIYHAIVRYTAQYRAENRETEIRSIFLAGIAFEIIMGLILSLVSFFMAGYFATTFYKRPEMINLIQIASFTILVNGLVSAATAVFIGTEKTIYYSIMIICQSIVKTLLIIGLVIAGFGTLGAVTGLTLATITAGLIGLAFTIHLYRKIPKNPNYKLELNAYTKEMLKFSTPIFISTLLSGVLAQSYIPIYGYFFNENILLGNYYVASNFIILINFFSLPITNVLFPAFSKLDIKKDKTTLKNIFQSSVKYSSLLVIPVTAIVMCLSTPAVLTLYTNNKWPLAPLFLTLIAAGHLLSATGNLSVLNLINSQGKTKLNLKFALLTATIGFPMAFFLIKYYGIFGLIFTPILAPLPSLILSIIWVKKHYDITINWTSSAKILLSSAITATLTYLLINFMTFQPAIELAIGTIFFITLLLGVLILTKTLSIHDLNNLRAITTGLGPITKIIHLILNTIEKIITKLKLT
ncbi:MAG: oligosaccharide flippase family protein [Candidatus Bathyarchaeota archaeon]|nr:oligosaccharide flippase family protein [Candidatus Termiticorpusculum sp.]